MFQHYSKSEKSEKMAADMNVIDQRQHNKEKQIRRQHNKQKRIQRQQMFAKKMKQNFIIISLIKNDNFTFRGLSRTVRHAKVYLVYL